MRKTVHIVVRAFPWLFNSTILLKRLVGGVTTLIDVGCGGGGMFRVIKEIDQREKLSSAFSVGLDVFRAHMPQAKKVYNEVVICDARQLPVRENSADVVICLHLIEHLAKKDGRKLISELNAIAIKQVIISTPVGWLPQTESKGNPWQRHRSAWLPEEFRMRGFKVIGLSGIGNIYNERCQYKVKHKTLRPFLHFIRSFSQFITYRKVSSAYQMLCVKENPALSDEGS